MQRKQLRDLWRMKSQALAVALPLGLWVGYGFARWLMGTMSNELPTVPMVVGRIDLVARLKSRE